MARPSPRRGPAFLPRGLLLDPPPPRSPLLPPPRRSGARTSARSSSRPRAIPTPGSASCSGPQPRGHTNRSRTPFPPSPCQFVWDTSMSRGKIGLPRWQGGPPDETPLKMTVPGIFRVFLPLWKRRRLTRWPPQAPRVAATRLPSDPWPRADPPAYPDLFGTRPRARRAPTGEANPLRRSSCCLGAHVVRTRPAAGAAGALCAARKIRAAGPALGQGGRGPRWGRARDSFRRILSLWPSRICLLSLSRWRAVGVLGLEAVARQQARACQSAPSL